MFKKRAENSCEGNLPRRLDVRAKTTDDASNLFKRSRKKEI